MNDTQKTKEILNALINYYSSWGRDRTNIIFPELRLGSGYNDIAQRRIDLFIISSEKGNYTTAFEIKVSRQDFLKDINDPLKQRGARLYSTNFYYVAPKGMIKIEEVPIWAGLKEYDFVSKEFKTTIPAPLQSRNNPSWGLICSIIRKVNKQIYKNLLIEKENELQKCNQELKKAKKLLYDIANNKIPQDFLDICLNEYKGG